MEEEREEFFSERKFIIDFDSFDKESYEEFYTKVNDSIEIPYRDLYLCSYGGSTMFIDPIKDILEKGDFTITAYSHIVSSGFLLYMYTNVPKRVLRGTTGAFHLPFQDGALILENGRVHHQTKIEKILMEKESYAVDFFQELLDITNAKRKKLESGIDEWLFFDDKKLQKLSDKSLKLLEKYK